MAYFVKMDDGTKIELPQELDVHERVQFCDELINTHEENFEVGLRNRGYRLEIMANYILNGIDKGGEYPIETEHRAKRNKFRERKFSELEQKYDKNRENY